MKKLHLLASIMYEKLADFASSRGHTRIGMHWLIKSVEHSTSYLELLLNE